MNTCSLFFLKSAFVYISSQWQIDYMCSWLKIVLQSVENGKCHCSWCGEESGCFPLKVVVKVCIVNSCNRLLLLNMAGVGNTCCYIIIILFSSLLMHAHTHTHTHLQVSWNPNEHSYEWLLAATNCGLVHLLRVPKPIEKPHK